MSLFNALIGRKVSPTISKYQAIVLISLLAVTILCTIVPYTTRSYDSWSYYFAIENFANGKLTINNDTHQKQVNEAEQGILLRNRGQVQYSLLEDNKWAFEREPGYPLLMVPFKQMGVPRAANILLLIATISTAYLLLRRMRDEKTACLGSLLLIFVPVGFNSLFWAYMPEYCAFACASIGGILYIYQYFREENKPNRIILLFSGLFLSYAVITLFSTILIALAFVVHFIFCHTNSSFRHKNSSIANDIIPFASGIAIPIAAIITYNTYVFGSLFDCGYYHSEQPIRFAWDSISKGNQFIDMSASQIFQNNIENLPVRIVLGFPIVLLAIPGIIYISWKRGYLNKIYWTTGEGDTWPEFPGHLLVLLVAWIITAFTPYFFYEYTAQLQYIDRVDIHLVAWVRYFLPGLLPLVIISALILRRLPHRLVFIFMTGIVLIGIVFLVQNLAIYDFNSL